MWGFVASGSYSLITYSTEALAANLEGIMDAFNCSRGVAKGAALAQ